MLVNVHIFCICVKYNKVRMKRKVKCMLDNNATKRVRQFVFSFVCWFCFGFLQYKHFLRLKLVRTTRCSIFLFDVNFKVLFRSVSFCNFVQRNNLLGKLYNGIVTSALMDFFFQIQPTFGSNIIMQCYQSLVLNKDNKISFGLNDIYLEIIIVILFIYHGYI